MSQGAINYSVSLATASAMQALAAFKSRLGGVGSAGTSALKGLASPVVGLVKGLGAVNQAMEGIGRMSQPLQALGGVMADASKAAADMEQTKVSFEVMIGSVEGATKVLADLKKMGAETPFEFSDLSKSAALLMNFGVESERVVETMRRLGDVSAIRDNLGQVAMIFGQVRAKAKLTGEELLQFNEAGVGVGAELARMLGTSQAALEKMISAGQIGFPLVEQAFINLTSEGGKFHKMMERQSQTTNGITSNLKDKITELKEAFGAPINDALRPILNDLIGAAERAKPLVADVGKNIRDWALYVAAAAREGKGMEAIWLPIKLKGLEAGNGISKAFKAMFADIRTEASVFGSWLEEKLGGGSGMKAMAGYAAIPQKPMGGLEGEIDLVRKQIEDLERIGKMAGVVGSVQKAQADIAKATRGMFDFDGSGGSPSSQAPGLAKAMATAKAAMDNRDPRAIMDLAHATEVATLKLRGLNKEAQAAEREKATREKIAEIMEKTGASYDKAREAALKLVAVEAGASQRMTGMERAAQRRQESQQGRDMRRAMRKQERDAAQAAKKEAAKVNPLDARKAPRVEVKFPGLDWIKDRKKVDLHPKKPEEKKPAKSAEVQAIEALTALLSNRLATV